MSPPREREKKRELSKRQARRSCVRASAHPPPLAPPLRETIRERGRARFWKSSFFSTVCFLPGIFPFACQLSARSIPRALLSSERTSLVSFPFLSLSLSSTPPNQPAMALASAAGRFLRGRRTAERLAVGLAAAPAAAAAAGALSSLSSSSSPSAAPLAQHQQSRRASGHAENTNTFIREVRQESVLCLRDD